jgi:hypothetical protein
MIQRKAMTLVLSVLMSTTFLVESAFAQGQARIYGEPNTFGSLSNVLSTGQTLSKIGDADLAMPPGRRPFFMASTSDGTVFSETFHQHSNNLLPTSCYMAITCINPTSTVCYDESDGLSKNYSTIYVKTRGGFKVLNNDESICLTPSTSDVFDVKGPDVTDIQRVVDDGGTEHVAFMSATAGVQGYPTTGFPVLGFLSKINGAWRLNSSKQYWRDQFGAALGGTVCPTLNANLGPDCGFAEMAFLPASRRLAMGFYGVPHPGLAIFDLNGTAQAVYHTIKPKNRCTPDPNDIVNWVGTRQVDVDPTGETGNERIVITVDGTAPFSHPIQELKYDDRAKTLEPVSNFVYTVSGSETLPDCTPQGQNANYDKFGNLVVGAAPGGKAVYHVYVKDKLKRQSGLEQSCPFTGTAEDNYGNNFGRGCLADLSVGEFTGLSDGVPQPKWAFVSHNISTDFDPGSSVLARQQGGSVNLLDEFQVRRTPVFVTYPRVSLDLDELPLAANVNNIAASKGILQAKTQSFWSPIGITLENSDQNGHRYVNQQHPGWFMELKYNEVLDAHLRVRGVKSTARKIRKSSHGTFKLIFKTNKKTLDFDPAVSGFWLFPNDSGQAVYHADVIKDPCGATGCSFRVRFPQNALQGLADGNYRWSVVVKGLTTDDLLHAQGIIPVAQ